jgi:lysozyme
MMAKYQSERPVLTYNQDYIMWQYSATGSIPGVKGEVDRSRIMGDYTLKQLKM